MKLSQILFWLIKAEKSNCETCKFHFTQETMGDACFHRKHMNDYHKHDGQFVGIPGFCHYINREGYCWQYKYQKPDRYCCETPHKFRAFAKYPLFKYVYCKNCNKAQSRMKPLIHLIFNLFIRHNWDGSMRVSPYPEKPQEITLEISENYPYNIPPTEELPNEEKQTQKRS